MVRNYYHLLLLQLFLSHHAICQNNFTTSSAKSNIHIDQLDFLEDLNLDNNGKFNFAGRTGSYKEHIDYDGVIELNTSIVGDIVVDSHQRTLVCGSTNDNFGNEVPFVGRFKANGNLDSTWGTNGMYYWTDTSSSTQTRHTNLDTTQKKPA